MKKWILILSILPFCAHAAPKTSLFFSPDEIISIMRAHQGFAMPGATPSDPVQSMDPGPRIISLSGIIYNGPKDWVIWLNGERVTPRNVPSYVMGITVKTDRVHLRWVDLGSNRIVNFTLRPHQRYILDTDTIVSGT